MNADDYISNPNNSVELDDHCANFIEDEVGRYHLQHNWERLLANSDELDRVVKEWLSRNNLKYNASDFKACVGAYIEQHKKGWSWAY
jgi:hypothetical protein